MQGTCSTCRQSVALYQKGDYWSSREPRPWVVGSHSRGRQYLCPGSHKPPLPKPQLPVRLMIIAAATALIIAILLFVLR